MIKFSKNGTIFALGVNLNFIIILKMFDVLKLKPVKMQKQPKEDRPNLTYEKKETSSNKVVFAIVLISSEFA